MRKTALVTGASSGIGYDLAGLFAQGGFDLVLTARNRAALDALAQKCQSEHGAQAEVLAADLADPACPQRIFDELSARSISVAILVNNAGLGTHGLFAEADWPSQLQMLQVNLVAATHLTSLFLPEMRKRGSGRILNVASMAGFMPGPYMSVYYATKAFMLSHSVALAEELRGTGVTVTALCPGPTRTDFQRRAGIDESRLFQTSPMDSISVARAGYRGLMEGKTIIIPGLSNKLVGLASRALSRSRMARIAGNLNRNR
jgi:hypothetical protein